MRRARVRRGRSARLCQAKVCCRAQAGPFVGSGAPNGIGGWFCLLRWAGRSTQPPQRGLPGGRADRHQTRRASRGPGAKKTGRLAALSRRRPTTIGKRRRLARVGLAGLHLCEGSAPRGRHHPRPGVGASIAGRPSGRYGSGLHSKLRLTHARSGACGTSPRTQFPSLGWFRKFRVRLSNLGERADDSEAAPADH
jgi:hypothetical protein